MNKRWVIPDIHGCKKTMQAMIEEQIVPSKNDTLFFLGDLVDRGPDSKGVLDYVMKLEEQEYDIQVLLGNHEDYCVKTWEADRNKKSFFGINKKTSEQKEWETHGGKQTLKSFGIEYPKYIADVYINWMKKCKYYIELENYILVHAGMNFKIDNPFEDTFSMIWVRDFKVDLAKTKNKKIIHGHVPVELEFIDLVLGSSNYNFLCLDNGVYIQNRTGYGNLLAFNIDTKEMLVQPNIDI